MGSQVQLRTVTVSHPLLSILPSPYPSGRPVMARPPAPGSVIVPDWHESAEGKEYLACILRKNRRRVFGKCLTPGLVACHSLVRSVTCCSLGRVKK